MIKPNPDDRPAIQDILNRPCMQNINVNSNQVSLKYFDAYEKFKNENNSSIPAFDNTKIAVRKVEIT